MSARSLRAAVFAAACAAAGYFAFGPPASAAVDIQNVQYRSGDASLDAYLAKPKGGGKHPAILLVHDDQGLTGGVQAVARLFAQSGFVVLAPNLISRLNGMKASTMVTTVSGPRRGSPVSPLDLNQTVDDVDAAFAFLQKDPGVDASKISAVGLGWGGWRVYKMAEDQPALHRAVVFYGVTPDDGAVGDIKAPVLAHYAQGDFLVTASSLITKKWLGNKFTYYVYPDTDHGFLGSGGGTFDLVAAAGEGVDLDTVARKSATVATNDAPAFNPTGAAKLSIDRTLKFLKN